MVYLDQNQRHGGTKQTGDIYKSTQVNYMKMPLCIFIFKLACTGESDSASPSS